MAVARSMAKTGRGRAFGMLVLTLIGASASVVLLAAIAGVRPVRLDLTAGGSHRLSPRASQAVDRLSGRYEIVLALDERGAERVTLDLVNDVLDAFDRADDRIGLTRIDVGGPGGQAAAARLLERLARREGPRLDHARELIAASIDAMRRAGAASRDLSTRLEAVRNAIPEDAPAAATNRAFFEQRAAVARVSAQELTAWADAAQAELDAPTGPGGLADTNRLLEPTAERLRGLETQLAGLSADLARFAAAAAMPDGARNLARPLAESVGRERDRIAVRRDRVERSEPVDVLRVGAALEAGEALLIVGPPERGVARVALDDIVRAIDLALLDRAGVAPVAVVGPRTEELITSALAALATDVVPIVVLAHGEALADVLDRLGFVDVRRRLAQRGIDVVEWAAAQEPRPPDLSALNPDGARPVVYVTIAPDSTAGSRGDEAQSGAQRATRFGQAIAGVASEGAPVLLSLAPSIYPSFGDPDPVASALEAFGLAARSGTPLLRSTVTARGPGVSVDFPVLGNEGNHPVSSAIAGLAGTLAWPIGIEQAGPDGVELTELLAVTDAAECWAETQWLTLWQTPRAQRSLLTRGPRYDAGVDVRRDRWPVAWAAETDDGRRLVVVGSNGWFFDYFTRQSVDAGGGRVAPAYPANAELFEAAVWWLAGQDDLIARSPSARPVATIRALSAGQLSAIRWALLGGVPALVLGLGLAYRLTTG